MKTYAEAVEEITRDIGRNFRCFGGGTENQNGNPISAALKDEPLQFALGVDVAQVVRFVLESGYRKGLRQ